MLATLLPVAEIHVSGDRGVEVGVVLLLVSPDGSLSKCFLLIPSTVRSIGFEVLFSSIIVLPDTPTRLCLISYAFAWIGPSLPKKGRGLEFRLK